MTDNSRPAQIDVDDTTQLVAQINYTATPEEEKMSHALKGSPPKIFDGMCENLENFMDEFDIYAKINRKNESMKEAYSQVLMCLSFIKGKTRKVCNWAKGHIVVLDKEIKDGMHYDDERLWTDFGNTFIELFTDTA